MRGENYMQARGCESKIQVICTDATENQKFLVLTWATSLFPPAHRNWVCASQDPRFQWQLTPSCSSISLAWWLESITKSRSLFDCSLLKLSNSPIVWGNVMVDGSALCWKGRKLVEICVEVYRECSDKLRTQKREDRKLLWKEMSCEALGTARLCHPRDFRRLSYVLSCLT